ncbi:hypothetical protein BBAD15_g11158 [Beauveria bassiana D1-5]|uniref:Uncharacterized protein n=1 Tax=Beauveria bassiana D1-5 TaxID=1245745 RepID=A0A0A2VBA3_BEABA|nr:hypothetical protein BBAD15_g11158 [Beauveria bassiana D1-5]
MRDTQPQLLQVARLGAAASFRPDSPRSRTDKSQRSSSQHWNQYPPRTAETRRWRPSHLDCHQQQQQQPQRYPKAAQRDVCTALRTPLNRKQVTFYGVPDSSGIGGGGGGAAASAGGGGGGGGNGGQAGRVAGPVLECGADFDASDGGAFR